MFRRRGANAFSGIRIAAMAAKVVAVTFPLTAQAANKTWDGGGANDSWNTAANWDGTGTGVAPVAGDALFFAGTTRLTPSNNFAANTSFVGLTFNSGAGAFSLSGAAINLGGNIVDNDDSVQQINLAMALTASRTVSVISGGTLEIGGVVSGATFGLTKNGPGTLVFDGSAVNTYDGGTVLASGSLSLNFANLATPTNLIDSASALTLNGATGGAGTTLTIIGNAAGATSQTFASTTLNSGVAAVTLNPNGGAGTTLDLAALTRNAGGIVNFTLPANATVNTATANANFVGGQQSILGGYATVGGNTWAVSGSGATPGQITGLAVYSGVFTAGTDVDAPAGASAPAVMTINSLRFNTAGAASVDTTAGLTLAAGGILVTAAVGNNPIAINNGSLTSGNGTELIVIQNNTTGANSTLDVGAVIANDGATPIGLTKAGAGILVLTGTNTYTGPTRIHQGVVVVSTLADGGAPSPLGASANATTNLQFTGGTLQYTGATATINRGALFPAEGAGGTIDVTQTGTTLTISGVLSGDGSTAGHPLIKAGTGVLTLSGTANNPTLHATIGGGKLILSKTSSATVHALSGASTVNTGGTLQLTGTGGDQIDDAASVTVNTGGSFDLNGLNESISSLGGGGTVTNSVAATTSLLTFSNGGLTFSGVIENGAGTVSVSKIGAGTQTLSGTNTYSGPTTVGGTGSLQLTSAGALGNTPSVTLTSTLASGVGAQVELRNNITINGKPLFMGSAGNRTALRSTNGTNIWGGDITLSGNNLNQFYADGGNLTVNGNVSAAGGYTGTLVVRGGSTGIINGTINIGTAAFSKTDSSTWTVAGLNNIWGGTQVSVGTVKVGRNNALPTTTVVTMGQADTNNATLDLNNFDQQIAGVVLNSTGGTKAITNSGAAMRTLTILNTTSNTYGTAALNGVLTANLNLSKGGAGTLTLGSANTYAGTTTITAGTLAISAAERLPNGTAVTLGGGTLATGGFSETVGTLALASNSTIDFGTGTSILTFADSSALGWTGTLTINNWSGNAELGGGTDQLLVGPGGLLSAQLAQINFTGFFPGAQILSTGEVVPIPEPASAAIIGITAIGLLARRRSRAGRAS